MLCSSSWYFMQFKTSLYYTSFSLYHDYSSVCLSRSTTLFWVAQIKAVILDHLYYLIPIIRNRSWYYGTAHEAATWDASILCKRLGYKAKLLCFQSRSLLMCLEKKIVKIGPNTWAPFTHNGNSESHALASSLTQSQQLWASKESVSHNLSLSLSLK